METREQPSFGALLRRYRGELGLSQEEMAARAGLSVQAVSALERGVTQWPYRDTVARLAAALGLAATGRRALEEAGRRPARRPAGTAAPVSPALPMAEDIWPASVLAPFTALIGRTAEIDRLLTLLARPGGRLLTVTGPGGIGKTRLAIEAARRLRGAYPDGVVFVGLASLREGALVPSAIARTLDVRDAPGHSMSESIAGFIGQRTLLLILDNCEHLIETSAEITARLLGTCPCLSVLATSRTALHLRGEQVFPLAPLALPPAAPDGTAAALPDAAQAALSGSPAIALFVERATAVDPDFTLNAANAADVAAICRQLDGLPLAIELAAAHCGYLTPRALLARLAPSLPLLTGGPRDLPARQRTLRDAIAWSYDLLPAAVQRVFRGLAVCAGGCTIASAAALCALDPDAADSLALVRHLETLARASLLAPVQRGEDEPRFAMLETIREYGLERLRECGELGALQARHANHFRELAEEAAPGLVGPRVNIWLERLDAEHDNLRGALAWALAAGEAEMALRTTGALWRFWKIRGHWAEGRRWLERALASGSGAPGLVRARALIGAGALAADRGDHAQAVTLYEESLALYRELNDKAGIAHSLNGLGTVAAYRGDNEHAAALLEDGLALMRELGDTRGVAISLSNLAQLAWRQGDYARAVALQEEGLALDREMGDTEGIASSLSNLGILARQLGDYARAAALQEESLALKRDLGHTRGIAASLENLGGVAREQGDYARAMALYEEGLAIMRALGDLRGVALSLNNLGAVACDRGEYERAGALLEESLIRMRQLENSPGIASVLNDLGYWAAEQGQYERAEALLDESLTLFNAAGDRRGTASALNSLGVVAERQGEHARAAALYAESLALRRVLGDKWGIAASLGNLGAVARQQGEYARAKTLLAESLQLSRELGARHVLLLNLEILVWVAGACGQSQRAARLGGSAQTLREALEVPLPPYQQAGHDLAVAALRAALGEEAFAVTWAAGASRSLDQALAADLVEPDDAEGFENPHPTQPATLAEARSRGTGSGETQSAPPGWPRLRVLPGGALTPPVPTDIVLGDNERAT